MKINIKKLMLLTMATLLGLAAYGQEKMEIDGAVVLGNSEDESPEPGTVRFNPISKDFEGWNGQWLSLTSSSGPSGSGAVTDIDGNQYLTVTIGTQTWMRENLRTSHYNDGTPIPEKTLNSDWNNASPAWCWYENNPAYDQPYGKLYNWYAIDTASNGGKNVCPSGWHMPSGDDLNSEWKTLEDTLGGLDGAAGKMKEAGLAHWTTPNEGATNESGFTGLPGGYRSTAGLFINIGFDGYWRSSTKASGDFAWIRYLFFNHNDVGRFTTQTRMGASVRCVRDN